METSRPLNHHNQRLLVYPYLHLGSSGKTQSRFAQWKTLTWWSDWASNGIHMQDNMMSCSSCIHLFTFVTLFGVNTFACNVQSIENDQIWLQIALKSCYIRIQIPDWTQKMLPGCKGMEDRKGGCTLFQLLAYIIFCRASWAVLCLQCDSRFRKACKAYAFRIGQWDSYPMLTNSIKILMRRSLIPLIKSRRNRCWSPSLSNLNWSCSRRAVTNPLNVNLVEVTFLMAFFI